MIESERDIIDDNELNALVDMLISKYKDELANVGANASHTLENSISKEIKIEGTYVNIYFNLEEYWKYVEEGVNGWAQNVGSQYTFTRPIRDGKTWKGMIPIEKIKTWILVKPYKTVPSTDKGLTSLAFGLAYKIKRDGILPRKPLERAMTENNYILDNISSRIADILETETINLINTMI